MRKVEFLKELEMRLDGLSDGDKKDILNYYQELIEDRMDDKGLLDEEVINELGSIDEIAKKVNPNYQFNNKTTYENESKVNNDNKAAKIICEVVRITLLIWLVVLGIVLSSVIVSIIGIIVYLIGYGILVLMSKVYVGLILLGIGICLIGLMIIFIPAVSKSMKFIKNYIDRLIKWIYIKLA